MQSQLSEAMRNQSIANQTPNNTFENMQSASWNVLPAGLQNSPAPDEAPVMTGTSPNAECEKPL